MNEEEKKKAELAEAEAAKKAEEEAKANSSQKGNDEEGKENDPDSVHEDALKQELEKERALRQEAEKERNRLGFELRQKKQDIDEDLDEDKPITVKQLTNILQEQEQKRQEEHQTQIFQDKVSKLTSNQTEKELILEIHKNRQWPKGMPVDDQLEEALLIANKKRIFAQQEELKKALLSKDMKSQVLFSPYRETFSDKKEPITNPQDNASLKMSGMVWDTKKGVWKKPIMGGRKHFYFDPKTNKRWTAS